MNYGRFFAMIATSTTVMMGLMYLNTYLPGHVFWSETRAYMALFMGAAMAVVMLGFMLSMYKNRMANAAIFVGAAIVFAGSLWLVRSQATIEDRSFMRAMIPHHSIAIMTSSRANISDPRVRKLADEIIYAQDKEIAEMRYLIADIGRSGAETTVPSEPASIMTLEAALATANVAPLDPEFMSGEEIGVLFPDGAACTFTYTEDSPPVLAVGASDDGPVAAVKISGDLVRLSADESSVIAARAFTAPGIAMNLSGRRGAELAANVGARHVEADLVLKINQGLTAGYAGYYGCG
ncbi:hypothetical protein DEA8626_04037 [Defluviimonas aquaemixtae]|uniref:DUF305 domain-containing protein n=1 Tax=Albidovulum aquaemixtae TaxID=1542388 RepID=A0A2R8BNJ2_9RHOB|nr:DUF305 domain-containing protein [Defluviimonas aquaemixtae]SPH25003.1 hypothetical protein DEA8626_04037 [Defluviimonas aquaemixtae]